MQTDRAEPNLTPILDMVFQLITFFLLVMNFKATDVNRDVELPVVGSATPDTQPTPGELLILNIRADGMVVSRGKTQPVLPSFLASEMKLFEISHQEPNQQTEPITVVLRADRSIAFQVLNGVLDDCKAAGFKSFVFVIVRKAESREAK